MLLNKNKNKQNIEQEQQKQIIIEIEQGNAELQRNFEEEEVK